MTDMNKGVVTEMTTMVLQTEKTHMTNMKRIWGRVLSMVSTSRVNLEHRGTLCG